MLCRVGAYRGPGFPNPTTTRISGKGYSFSSPFPSSSSFFLPTSSGSAAVSAVSPASGSLVIVGGTTEAIATVVLLEDLDVGKAQVAHVQRVADHELRHVHRDLVGDVRRQALDEERAHRMLQDAPVLLHPHRHPRHDDRHFDFDALGHGDAIEVHVDHFLGEGIDLDLADQGLHRFRLSADHEVDDQVGDGVSLHQAQELPPVELDEHRILALAVEDSGHSAVLADLASRALPGAGADLRVQLDRR